MNSFEMRVLEENSEYLGVSRLLLMENAGRSVADVVRGELANGERVVVVAGLGNNGGDGFVAARHLARDYEVHVVLLGKEGWIRTDEARANWRAVKSQQLTIKTYEAPTTEALRTLSGLVKEAGAIIDAIFGTGLRGEVRGIYRDAIELINESKGVKVAVDVPSGLNPDTGEVHGVAVRADVTVTFHALKPGLVKEGAKEYVGRIVVAPIGIPPEAEIVCGPGDVKAAVSRRPAWSKKGDNGRVLVVGGSDEYTGAPALTAMAALRAGADLVVVAAPREAAQIIRSFSPNIIARPLGPGYLRPDDVDTLLEFSKRFDVVAVGPGLGLREETMIAVTRLLRELDRPVVVDADGLKALPRDPECLKGKKSIMTPHAGELKVLTGVVVSTDVMERVEAAKNAARTYGSVVLLKGHVDVISDGERYKVNRTGSPAMTVGGTGDVLTGVTATLLAQTGNPFLAACASAHVNGLAGEIAAEEKGQHITATDVLEALPRAFRALGVP